MINALIETLNKDYLKYVCIIENLKSDNKEILYLSSTSVAFKILPSNIVMIAGEVGFEKAVEKALFHEGIFFTPNAEIKKLLEEKKGIKSISCKQYLYGRQEIENSQVEIKKLSATQENIKVVKDNYTLGYSEAEIRHLLSDRLILGGFVDGEICGFVGMHEELSVGLLEVLDKFKRRGIGSILLKTCVNYFLDNNFVPFCHVRSENLASIELHKKLNCEPCSEEVYWF